MKQNSSPSDPAKKPHLPDKTLLWMIAFIVLAVLCVLLILVVKPWILKVLFLLLGVGAAGYSWLMMESRRIKYTPSSDASQPSAPLDGSAVETGESATAQTEADVEAQAPSDTETEAPAQPREDVSAEKDAQPIEPTAHMVYITEKGDKYHLDRKCFGLRFADSVETMTREEASSLKRKPCSKCCPKTGK